MMPYLAYCTLENMIIQEEGVFFTIQWRRGREGWGYRCFNIDGLLWTVDTKVNKNFPSETAEDGEGGRDEGGEEG